MDRAVVLIGRAPECDVVIRGSRKISRRHCCLVHSDDAYLIRDLGSMNGVWINGQRVDREAEMKQGDQVAIGDLKFEFLPEARVDPQPSAADRELSGEPEVMEASIVDSGTVDVVSDDGASDLRVDPVIIDSSDVLEGIDVSDENVIEDLELLDVPTPPDGTDIPRIQGEPARRHLDSEPVISLDDSFADEDVEDIIVFDDD